jgi:hypothetical protein
MPIALCPGAGAINCHPRFRRRKPKLRACKSCRSGRTDNANLPASLGSMRLRPARTSANPRPSDDAFDSFFSPAPGFFLTRLSCEPEHNRDLRSDQGSNSSAQKQCRAGDDVMQVAWAFVPIAPSGPNSQEPCRCSHAEKNGSGIDRTNRNSHVWRPTLFSPSQRSHCARSLAPRQFATSEHLPGRARWIHGPRQIPTYASTIGGHGIANRDFMSTRPSSHGHKGQKSCPYAAHARANASVCSLG